MLRRLTFCLLALGAVLKERHQVEGTGDGKNTPIARTLCTIKGLLQAVENVKTVEYTPHPNHIVEEIEKLNMSTLPEKLFSQPAIPPYSEGEWKAKQEGLKDKVTTFAGDEVAIEYVGSYPRARIGNARIAKLLEGARRVLGDINKVRQDEVAKLQKAKEFARRALFATNGTAASDESFAQTVVKGCGQARDNVHPGESAGMSLVNDFVCLCGKGTATRDGKACTDGDGAITAGTNWASQSNARSDWGNIKGLCVDKTPERTSSQEIRSAIQSYYAFVNGEPGSAKKGLVVGFSNAGDGFCGAAAHTACVSYPNVGQNDRAAEPDAKKPPFIEWASNGVRAADYLDETQEAVGKLQALQSTLVLAHGRAWEIYEQLLLEREPGGTKENSSPSKEIGTPAPSSSTIPPTSDHPRDSATKLMSAGAILWILKN